MTAFYIIISLMAVIMLILLIPADCIIDFSYNNEENRGSIIIKYLFFKFKLFPTAQKAEEAEEEVEEKELPEDKKDIWGLIKFARTVYHEFKQDIYVIVRSFFKNTIRVKELNISAHFGTGDPMYTGIAAGAVNAAVYNAVAAADRHMVLDRWKVSLEPDFDNACICAGIYMKIRISIISAVSLGIRAAVLFMRIQKMDRRIKENG